MTLRPIYTQGELTAFIPELNSNVTAGVAHHAPEAVASRPDHAPASGPAGTPISYIKIEGILTPNDLAKVKSTWLRFCRHVGRRA